MTNLICFGLGYSAEHFIEAFAGRFEHIAGTVRNAERATTLNARASGRLQALIFDGKSPTLEVENAIGEADLALVSIPQTEAGDPVLTVFANALAQAQRLRAIVYLSTIGVYGDRGGAWVDEQTPAQPHTARARNRLAAERRWQEFGIHRGVSVGKRSGRLCPRNGHQPRHYMMVSRGY